MKNHVRINGRLLQMNKRFSQLKQKQKEWIAEVFKATYHAKMQELNTDKKLTKISRDEVISKVYSSIEEREIWIPFDELEKYCFSKINKMVNSYNGADTQIGLREVDSCMQTANKEEK